MLVGDVGGKDFLLIFRGSKVVRQVVSCEGLVVLKGVVLYCIYYLLHWIQTVKEGRWCVLVVVVDLILPFLDIQEE